MTDTRFQKNDIEEFVREKWLKKQFPSSAPFSKQFLPSLSGGRFECDAVSHDKKIAGMITTQSSKTCSGKNATGSLKKVCLDVNNLANIEGLKRRIVICTELSMAEYIINAQRRGKLPDRIEVMRVELPAELKRLLQIAKKNASEEILKIRRLLTTICG